MACKPISGEFLYDEIAPELPFRRLKVTPRLGSGHLNAGLRIYKWESAVSGVGRRSIWRPTGVSVHVLEYSGHRSSTFPRHPAFSANRLAQNAGEKRTTSSASRATEGVRKFVRDRRLYP